MEVVGRLLPADRPASRDEIEKALAAGAQYLQEYHAIPIQEAQANLKLAMRTTQRQRADYFRSQASLHEQAGEWAQAMEYYVLAAEIQKHWDRKDHDFLLACIQRVQAKQAR